MIIEICLSAGKTTEAIPDLKTDLSFYMNKIQLYQSFLIKNEPLRIYKMFFSTMYLSYRALFKFWKNTHSESRFVSSTIELFFK